MNNGTPWSDRYIPTEPLGEGGMAQVWRAWDRRLGAWCAMKVLRSKYAEQRDARRRFLDEGRLLIQLDHRNVIHGYDLLDEDPPCVVMEVADGGSLLDWVERHGPMPPRMAVGIAIQVCKGLGAAHRANVIHRDVKPHNVLVNRKGVCKVSDFGIARIPRRDGTHDVPDATTVSQTSNDPVGTLGYMAPEQRSDPRAADFRTDIYGVGAALYHLVIGGPNPYLFAADKNPEVLRDIPEPLRAVMLKTVAYRPEDRFPNIRELSLALYYVRDQLPEDPPGTPQLAEGLPPEPKPPEGMSHNMASEGRERVEEHDIEVPTTIRRPERAPRADEGRKAAPAEPSRTSSPQSAIEGRLNRSISRGRAPPSMLSEADLRRPGLVAGTRLWVVALAMIGFVLASLLADFVYVLGYQRAAEHERDVFIGQVNRSRKSLEDTLATVPQVDVVQFRKLFDDLLHAQTLERQLKASNALGVPLEQAVDQLVNCPSCPQGRRHVAILLEEQQDWEDAHVGWIEASETFPGWIAVYLGLNRMPPLTLP
jgi:serine/threonine protein kinase